MAKHKPEYEGIDEYTEIAKEIADKYPELFEGLDVESVKCVGITNKDREDKIKCMWEVKSVPYPIRLDCPYGYYVIIYSSDWVEMDQKHKAALVFDSLQSIPTESDRQGQRNNPDLKGFGASLRTLGLDFMDRDDIPNLLTDSVNVDIRR